MKENFIEFAASSLRGERFKLLDIGCSGGIDPTWRAFEPWLQALGIDASADECGRLAELETNPNVSYVAAFVGRSAEKPVDLSDKPADLYTKRLFDRLSVKRMLDIRKARLEASSAEEKMRHNAWAMTNLADPGKPIVATDLLANRCWANLDYLKIDVDGADFDILRSFDSHLERLGVVAVQLEVNFYGTGGPEEHSFHNTDRFMRQHGYELFRLDNRTYSACAIPARFALTSDLLT